MRGRKSSLVVLLTDTERHQLQAWCRATTTRVGLVRRATAVLAVHAGQSIKEAARSAGLSETHTRKWLKRFLAARLIGLEDATRPGRPKVFSPGGSTAHRQDRL